MKRGKRLLAILLCATMLLTLCSCGGVNKQEIKNTISEFEYACQRMDLKAMLKCIDSDISDPIRMTISIFDAASGQTTDDLLDQLTKTVFGDQYDPADFLTQLHFTDIKVKVSGKRASVTCNLNFVIGQDSYSKKTKIQMRKTEDQWYISRIEFDSQR